MEYKSRIIDIQLQRKLKSSGAVLIRGPKWCGKTTTAKQLAKTVLSFQNPKKTKEYKELFEVDPDSLLIGEKPLLIDEWQIIPEIWNSIKFNIDENNLYGSFILTGSTTPPSIDNLHPGTGRIIALDMKPMSLYESKDSNGLISLTNILEGNLDINGIKSTLTIKDYAFLICCGGWPSAINKDFETRLDIPNNYINSLCSHDIISYDNTNRNSILARDILRAYSRLINTIESNKRLYDDVRSLYGSVSDNTIIDYLNVFRKLYIIEDIEAWNPNILSRTSIVTSSKKSFVDPSIACAALSISPDWLLNDITSFGNLFENLVSRDLSIYSSLLGGTIKHYRDRFGVECDCIITFKNGKYCLVQVKLGSSKIQEAIDSMLRICNKIESKMEDNPSLKLPDFMMVITAGEYAYKSKEGVYIIPLGCLKD
jgi:predicted AAA+ superfamily ATPase